MADKDVTNISCDLDTEWVEKNYQSSWKDRFEEDGFLVIRDLIQDERVVKSYIKSYEELLDSSETTDHRFDLGSHKEEQNNERKKENICQIMWPSMYDGTFLERPIFKRLLTVVRKILGEDMDFDFDMLINKFPYSGTPTPWHQDESYWPDMPDKRAVSCWVALDDATVENGCMWFVRGSHQEEALRPHRRVKEGHHARCTDSCSEREGQPQPLKRGSCTLHHGRTLHYTRGNNTGTNRRAYIMNFRPKEMVQWERDRGFDHGKTK
eukprot:TCONS_00062911-protein